MTFEGMINFFEKIPAEIDQQVYSARNIDEDFFEKLSLLNHSKNNKSHGQQSVTAFSIEAPNH